MMRPSEIRDELLSQHADLRERLQAVRRGFEQWARGEASRARVRDQLAQLADALQAHDEREERVLRELIGLDDRHVREHRELVSTLGGIRQVSDPHEGGGQLQKFCTRVLQHMSQEEKAFLNASVLTDDAEPNDAPGG
jgi:hypothetical protein